MRINHNIAALNTHRQMANNTAGAGKAIEKLSSGLRINRAGDDAAGLAISEKMRGQIRGLEQSNRNAQDGISLIQTAEGALNETHSILQRMRELGVQASNGTSTTDDKQNIQDEMNQLISEIDRIANDTEFNTKKLLNGDLSQTSRFSTYTAGTTSGIGISTVTADPTATLDSSVQLRTAVDATAAVLTGNSSSVWVAGNFSGASGATLLTDLSGTTDGGLQVGDEITLSAVVGGEVKNAVFVVESTSTFQQLADTIKNTLGASSVSVATSGSSTNTASGVAGLDAWGASGAYDSGTLIITGQAGAANDITSFSITAKSSTGTSRDSFNQTVNGGANSGLYQYAVAGNTGDIMMLVDFDADNAGDKGDAVVAVRANAVITTANMTFQLDSTAVTSGLSGTVTVAARDNRASIHIGANEGQTTSVGIDAMDATALGLKTNNVNISVLTSQAAEDAITVISDALSSVSTERSKLGAIQNRLEHTINNLGTSAENLTASESRVRDVDMAKEMMEFTKNNILSQAAQAMMAQANQQPQGVLQLLR